MLKIKKMTRASIIAMALLSTNAMSASTNSKYKREEGACFPTSNQTYAAGLKSNTAMSEAEFNLILDKVHSYMSLEIKRRLNKDLILEKRWSDPTVDAFATRDDLNNAVVVMNGGLARHPLMTKDGLQLLACHEIGHHLGGAPKIPRGTSGLRGWSSAEGQADYFATTKCLPVLFKNDNDNRAVDLDLDSLDLSVAGSKCRDQLCSRIALAGLSVSKVFASLIKGQATPSLMQNDPTKVTQTLYKHPNPQCRLDTYFSGANCDLGIEFPFDTKDPKVGACVKDLGIRPSCWFSEEEF